MTALLRSMLYVPADNPRRVEKAFSSGADAILLDLEDAVAVSKKAEARQGLKTLLTGARPCAAYVRVNALRTDTCLDDIEAAVAAGADGISFPKVETAADLFAIDWLIGQLERRYGRPAGSVDLLAVIESGRGLAEAHKVLGGVKRVKRAGLGVGDLSLELNLMLGADQAEARAYRAQLVLACNAAGIEAPLDTVWLDLDNLDGLRASCIESRRMGFAGRRCIHPKHVPIINEVYAPSEAEISKAEKIVADFKAAEAGGLATLRVGDVFVDYPIARKAERTLALRDAIQARAKRG
jgi:citrate lyase subunit beta/citryl-CoA lyase